MESTVDSGQIMIVLHGAVYYDNTYTSLYRMYSRNSYFRLQSRKCCGLPEKKKSTLYTIQFSEK